MKIIITGAFGFVGSHLIEALGDHHEVIGIWNNEYNENRFNSVRLVNSSKINSIQDTPDVVILCHAAVSSGGVDSQESNLQKSNIEFTETIAKQFPNSYFIYLSTTSIYKESIEKISEQSIVEASTPYAKSKLAAENIVAQLNKRSILRLPSLFGTFMNERTIIPNYVNQALKNNEVLVYGDGTRTQNYLSISELINYVLKCVEKRPNGRYLVVAEREHTNLEVATIISEYLSAKLTFVKEDYSVSFYYNNEASKLALGLHNDVNFTKEIKKYIDWKKKQS